MQWFHIIAQVIALLSPEVRQEISTALDKVAAKAKATKLPFDDIAVMVFRGLTGL